MKDPGRCYNHSKGEIKEQTHLHMNVEMDLQIDGKQFFHRGGWKSMEPPLTQFICTSKGNSCQYCHGSLRARPNSSEAMKACRFLLTPNFLTSGLGSLRGWPLSQEGMSRNALQRFREGHPGRGNSRCKNPKVRNEFGVFKEPKGQWDWSQWPVGYW